jgi:hypothetical protein
MVSKGFSLMLSNVLVKLEVSRNMADVSASKAQINRTGSLRTFWRDVLCLSAGWNSRTGFVCYLLPCITYRDSEDGFSTFIRNINKVLYNTMQRHIPEYKTITLQKTVLESNYGKQNEIYNRPNNVVSKHGRWPNCKGGISNYME